MNCKWTLKAVCQDSLTFSRSYTVLWAMMELLNFSLIIENIKLTGLCSKLNIKLHQKLIFS